MEGRRMSSLLCLLGKEGGMKVRLVSQVNVSLKSLKDKPPVLYFSR